MSDKDDFKVIATTATPVVTSVRFYAETIEKVKIGHPEIGMAAGMPSIETAVASAITTPSRVEQKREKSVVFVDEKSTNSAGDPLRVPVRIVEGTSGRVATFFFASTEEDEAKK